MRGSFPLAALALVLVLVTATAWLTLRGCEHEPPAAVPTPAPAVAADVPAAPAPAPRRRHVGTPSTEEPARDAPTVTSDAPQAYVLIVRRSDTGAGVPGLIVRATADRRRARRTDADGVVRFDPREGELSLEVEAAAPGAEALTLLLTETVIEVPPPVPLTVRWVDAETGGRAPSVSVSLTRDSAADSGAGTGEIRFDTPPLWPGHAFELQLAVDVAASDWVAPASRELSRRGVISRYAERAEILVPIRRAAAVRAVVRDHRGHVVSGARVRANSAALTSGGETGANGHVLLSGLPFFRGETVHVVASVPGRPAASGAAVLRELGVAPTVELELPEPVTSWNSSIGIGGGAGGSMRGRGGSRTLRAGTSSVIVSVERRDGTPAVGAWVGVRGGSWQGRSKTDDDGVARFSRLPGGDYRISCSEHGLASMADDVVLADGQTLHVTLREPPGRWVHVRVVDTEGRGLPHVRLDPRDPGGSSWVPLDRGVQRLDVYTDAGGEARLFVPRDTSQLVATYGSREAHVRQKNGQDWSTEILTITVPD